MTGPHPPDFWRTLAEAPAPPRADREAGPREVLFPPELAPRLGSYPFDYYGQVLIEDNPLPDPWVRHLIEFTVPQHLVGVVTGIAAGLFLSWYNEELAVELFVGNQPRLGAVVLNQAIGPGGIPIEASPFVSADLSRPTALFIPLDSEEIVYLAATRGSNANPFSTIYPAGDDPVAYGRLVGRFWDRRLGMSSGR